MQTLFQLMNHRTRLFLLSLFFLAALVGVPVLLTWRAVRQERLDRALITAVNERYADAVVSLLKQGADPNTRERSGGTVSIWQAFRKLFLRFRQRDTSAPQEGDTALILALEIRDEIPPVFADPHIVQALLDAGANPNCRKVDDHMTPLEVALRCCPSQVQHLLDKGADVNARDDNGDTPLMFVSENDPAIVRLLLDRGADVEATDNIGKSILMQLCGPSACGPKIIGLLLDKGAEVGARDEDGQTALMWAAEAGNVAGVRLLLDRDADINAQDADGQTALMLAAENNQTQTVKTLLVRHADVARKDKSGLRTLVKAYDHANTEIIRLLKQAGAKE